MNLFRRRRPQPHQCDECARLRWFLKQVIGEKKRLSHQLDVANASLTELGSALAAVRAEEARERVNNLERMRAVLDAEAEEEGEDEAEGPAPAAPGIARRIHEVHGDGWQPPPGAITAAPWA